MTVSHLQCSPGTASKETRALRSDWPGVPEASIMRQFTAPIAKVSCSRATFRVASDPAFRDPHQPRREIPGEKGQAGEARARHGRNTCSFGSFRSLQTGVFGHFVE
ncbi:hypothetical protein KIP88_21965 [Bradyrhizobium sp. SRL28]|uniref:hypothetical protein n=1 Tax=Bradyrhizobium sp. SRL28 TaxID=2836178 RepID=UPI001BDEB742|nr:hypothetical protein [Bradyrhizobium sp. SRL28]MBT1513162.1 hypothetical protein [Bradyrhizobium sp. SRL28]